MDIDSSNRTDDATDELDSVRDYLNTIEDFIHHQKATRIAAAREKLGLPEGLAMNDKGRLRGAEGKN